VNSHFLKRSIANVKIFVKIWMDLGSLVVNMILPLKSGHLVSPGIVE